MFRLRKMHLIYVYVPVFTLNNFLLVLVCSYEYWQVQVYFTLLFIPQHNPLCREPAICISRWNLLRTSGWRRRLASFSGYHKDSPGTPRPRPKFWASDVDPCGQALYPQPNSNLQGVISEILATSINVYLRCACLTYYKQPECKNSFFLWKKVIKLM